MPAAPESVDTVSPALVAAVAEAAAPVESTAVRPRSVKVRRRPRLTRAQARSLAGAAPATPSRAKPSLKKRIGAKLLSTSVLFFTGALVVGLTVPADLFAPQVSTAVAQQDATAVQNQLDVQNVEVAAGEQLSVTRDNFTITTYVETLKAKYGTRDYSYTTTGSGAVRWPFPSASPISDGFGARNAPCRGCSSQHQGVDFTPGGGTPIYAIADGVVSIHQEGGGFGNHVYLEHVINGQQITSVYAHMQWGSSPLVEGQTVKAGDFVGLVGSTGASTGSHLHLEIHLDGVPIDPFAWLQQNAG